MEARSLESCLNYLIKDEGLNVTVLGEIQGLCIWFPIMTKGTDGSTSVKEMLTEKFPQIRRELDPWHFVKVIICNLYTENCKQNLRVSKKITSHLQSCQGAR